MNHMAQRVHTRRTDELAHVIADTQEAVVGRFEEVEASFAAMHDKYEALKARVSQLEDRLQTTDEELDDLLVAQAATSAHVTAHRTMGARQRWHWLLTGR